MDIRPFETRDREACLALIPHPEFAAYLDNPSGPFFAMEHEGEIVGCGGIVIARNGEEGELVWGSIRKEMRGHGLGRFLLLYRLREIGKAHAPVARVETSTESAPFFEKQGFRAVRRSAGRVELVRKLSVCA